MQFLCEDLLLEKLAKAVEEQLSGANTSRTFYGKSLAHGLPPPSDITQVIGLPKVDEKSSAAKTGACSTSADADGSDEPASTSSSSVTGPAKAPAKVPYKMVRTDATMGNLRSFLYTKDSELGGSSSSSSRGTSSDAQRSSKQDSSCCDHDDDGMPIGKIKE